MKYVWVCVMKQVDSGNENPHHNGTWKYRKDWQGNGENVLQYSDETTSNIQNYFMELAVLGTSTITSEIKNMIYPISAVQYCTVFV